MTAREFQAVVLAAGRGSRMTELTVGRPKCLLPVGQHPVLYNTLSFLEKNGFKDAIVVVLNSALGQIQAALSRCDLKILPEFVAIPAESEDWGTAESLQYLVSQERIKSDVVLISCDLYTNGNLSEIFLLFRQHDASLAALFFHPCIDSTQSEEPPGAKNKYKSEKDIIGIDKETSRLVFLSSVSDFEENVPFKRSILRRHPQISIRTDLVDGHIYVMSLRLVKFLSAATSFGTLKGEFLPYIVGKQHTRQPVKNSAASQEKVGLLHEHLKNSNLVKYIKDASSYIDHRGDLKDVYHGDNIRCYAVIADAAHFGIRINSIPSLWHVNRLIISRNLRQEERIDSTANIQSNQVEDSFVGPGSSIQEKTSVRSSIIGENCIVQPKSRIVRSVALKMVEFNSGCVIENCVIGNDVKIGANCELKNCVVGAHHEITAGTKANFQIITQSDRLMEI